MASAGPDTEGSQFFVTHSAQPHLDADYTAFGWVEEGMEVVDVIYQGNRVIGARVEPDDAPVTGGAPAAASEGPP
jgi:peptidylprolyl isomerase